MQFAGVEVGDEMVRHNELRHWTVPEPAVSRNRGEGPFERTVLRGCTVIDGSGAPPWGPADIVMERDRITDIQIVGTPGMIISADRRPGAGTREIDCTGCYVTPGIIDSHAHIGTPHHSMSGKPPPADYVYKLWLAHGVTTVRETGALNGTRWTLDQRDRAARGEIAAPRLLVYAYFPAHHDLIKTLSTAADARKWVDAIAELGANGIKFLGAPPLMMQAALDEAKKLGLRSACHHAQLAVSRMNSLQSARWGLTSTEHYYGIGEALFVDRRVQNYIASYNYNNEYDRFAYAGKIFQEAAKPGSVRWHEVLQEYLDLNHTFVPTMVAYDANRDVMRARNADWHSEYTWPTIWKYFQPQRGGHGSYWYHWTTGNEIDWKNHYKFWMQFINDYKNMGGRVCAGSDSGFIYQIYGFGIIRELELLREAGFNALETWKAATADAAELLGLAEDVGIIDIGKKADILIHSTNPLDDIKPLYGTGTVRLNAGSNQSEMLRGLKYTICGGIIYDPELLLCDVREMVEKTKRDPDRMQV